MTNLFSSRAGLRHYPSIIKPAAPALRTPSLRLVWLRRDGSGQARTEARTLPLPRP